MRGKKVGEPGGDGDLLHCHLHHLLTHHSHTLPLHSQLPLAVGLEHRRNCHVGTAAAVVVSFYASCTCTAVSAYITADLSCVAVLVVEVSDAAVEVIFVFICDVVRDVTSGAAVADVDVVLVFVVALAVVAVLVVVADLSIVAVDVIPTVAVVRSINSFEGVAVKT